MPKRPVRWYTRGFKSAAGKTMRKNTERGTMPVTMEDWE